MATHSPDDYEINNPDDEYLTRVVVDVTARTFYLYSNEGDKRVVDNNTVDEFMTLLSVIRDVVDDDIIAYTDPMVKTAP
jgi:imidazoleglycerol phosphate dehydratase HisB